LPAKALLVAGAEDVRLPEAGSEEDHDAEAQGLRGSLEEFLGLLDREGLPAALLLLLLSDLSVIYSSKNLKLSAISCKPVKCRKSFEKL
jgi:hypothetical protein